MVLNVGDRPVRDVVVRLEHAAAVTSSAGLRTNLAGNVDQYEPVADFITLAPELLRGQNVPFTLAYPLRSAELPSLDIEQPGVYPVMVNVNGTPDYGAACATRRCPLPAAGARRAARPSRRCHSRHVDGGRPAGHLQTRATDRVVADRRPAATGRGSTRRHHTGPVDRRRTRDVAGRRRTTGHVAVRRRVRHQFASRSRRSRSAVRRAWPSTPTCLSPSTR